jgi:hypothetical protein
VRHIADAGILPRAEKRPGRGLVEDPANEELCCVIPPFPDQFAIQIAMECHGCIADHMLDSWNSSSTIAVSEFKPSFKGASFINRHFLVYCAAIPSMIPVCFRLKSRTTRVFRIALHLRRLHFVWA